MPPSSRSVSVRKTVSREHCLEGPLSEQHYRQHFREGAQEEGKQGGELMRNDWEEQSPCEYERSDVEREKSEGGGGGRGG